MMNVGELSGGVVVSRFHIETISANIRSHVPAVNALETRNLSIYAMDVFL